MKLTIDQALQKAITAHKEGKYQDAESFYQSILKSQPKHADANHNLGILLFSTNKALEALPLFKIALETNPKIEQYWLSYIDALIKVEHFTIAKKILNKVNKQGFDEEKFNNLKKKLPNTNINQNGNGLNPSDDQINSLLDHYQKGRFADAEDCAISMTDSFPKHHFAWKILGTIYLSTSRLSEALNANQKAIELSPQDAEVYNILGLTYKELGRLEEAEASCLKAIKLNPKFFQAHSNLGNILKELDKPEEAKAYYLKAIAINPSLAEAHSNLGNVFKDLNRIENAEASYLQALELNPNLAQAHSNLGDIYRVLGRFEEAESCCLKAIELNPSLAEAHNNLGATYKEIGRIQEAESCCLKAIELNPNLAEAHIGLGIILKELNRLNEAEVCLKEAIELKPDMLSAIDHMGDLMQMLGRFEDAEIYYKKCISIAPTYNSLTKSLASRLQAEGKFKEALSLFDSYDTPDSRSRAIACLYALGKTKEIYKRIDDNQKLDDKNIGIAAFSTFIAQDQKKDTANRFCRNPLDFLHISNLSSKIKNSNFFIENLINDLKNVGSIWDPPNQSGNGGFKSIGNLFEYSNSNIVTLKEIILKEIDVYYEKFQNEKCTFIEKWPVDKNLLGWHIILKEDGYHNSHIHPEGWLSGVIYLKVVPTLNENEGAIKFDLAVPDYPNLNLPNKIHNPQIGDIVFFPSSLYHGTVPFSTDTERIIVSFDLQPD